MSTESITTRPPTIPTSLLEPGLGHSLAETADAPLGDARATDFRLEQVDLLTEDERQRLETDIFALEQAWIRRDPESPFFTLGVAAYLDATDGRSAEYLRRALELRGPMEAHFGWLYDRVRAALGGLLGEPCDYSPTLALPGFHIFLEPPGTAGSASLHYDRQADHCDWSGHPGVDLDRQLSFTLSVRLPEEGGGLLVWSLNGRLLPEMDPEERRALIAAERDPAVVPYQQGRMVVHNGQFLHQIAGLRATTGDMGRITFQGHAVGTEDGWILYW